MDMFFVKQMQALNEFFLLCRCYAAASKGKLTQIHDGDHVTRKFELLHFKSVHPLWKILKSVAQGECEFSNVPTFCVILDSKVYHRGSKSLI